MIPRRPHFKLLSLTILVGILFSALSVLASDDIPFTTETLDNGMKVIYAPLHQAPVVHVRVLYHVGSRDERPDRQGFAHMFGFGWTFHRLGAGGRTRLPHMPGGIRGGEEQGGGG